MLNSIIQLDFASPDSRILPRLMKDSVPEHQTCDLQGWEIGGVAVGGQHKIQGRALRNRCKLCVAILLWPWSSFASAPARFWIFTLEFGSMGQFPSSMLGGCECGGGDLAILDSAGRLTLLWILLAPPDLQNLTK